MQATLPSIKNRKAVSDIKTKKTKNFFSRVKQIKFDESTISVVLGLLVLFSVIYLVVNYFKNRNLGETIPAQKTENTVTPQKGNTYTVVKGDTLWNIAENAYGSGFNWTDIATENKIANANSIDEGQILNIPEVESKVATVSEFGKLTNEETTDTATATDDTYTVVRGDCLWDIAVKSYGDGYKWVEIAKTNGLVHPNLIHTGNVLTLPR